VEGRRTTPEVTVRNCPKRRETVTRLHGYLSDRYEKRAELTSLMSHLWQSACSSEIRQCMWQSNNSA